MLPGMPAPARMAPINFKLVFKKESILPVYNILPSEHPPLYLENTLVPIDPILKYLCVNCNTKVLVRVPCPWEISDEPIPFSLKPV